MGEAVELRQEEDYRFAIDFGGGRPVLRSDEPPPLGAGAGPNPLELLAAAVGNCLSSSLRFALAKFHQSADPFVTRVEPVVGRNEKNRLRVQAMRVRITLNAPAAALAHLDRALAQFEDFCTVTASVRAAFPVEIEVYDAEGTRVK